MTRRSMVGPLLSLAALVCVGAPVLAGSLVTWDPATASLKLAHRQQAKP